MRCPRCNHAVKPQERYCTHCGLARDADGELVDRFLGITLDGRYTVDKRIGVGGMATVYLGRHSRTGQKVAVKVLHERYARDPQIVPRFENEALTYGRLSHPNLVMLHDYGRTEDDALYAVLEYCPGIPLSRLVHERKRLAVPTAVDLALQVAQGLAVAHAAGIVHRDLKPDNILVFESRPRHYHAKVLDFGIAKYLDDDKPGLTQAGMVFGTPEYMSPEQARGEPVDIRSDIYALGVILFEMLAGRPPFVGGNRMGLMHRHASETPPSLIEVGGPGLVPAPIDRVVRRCLQKSVGERFPDVEAFISALERAVDANAADNADAVAVTLPPTPPPFTFDEGGAAEPAPTVGDVDLTATEAWPDAVSGRRRAMPQGASTGLAAVVFCGTIAAAAWFWSLDGDASPPVSSPTVDSTELGPLTDRSVRAESVAKQAPARIEAVRKPKLEIDSAARERARRNEAAEAKRAAEAARARIEAEAQAAREAEAKARRERAARELDAAKVAVRAGRFADAERALTAALAARPDQPDVKQLQTHIETLRSGFDEGRRAFEGADCVTALAVLQPVLDAAPESEGIHRMVDTCRKSLPPRTL